MLLCKKGYNFLLGRTICRLCFILVVIKFIFRVHNYRFKVVGTFEDNLYTSMLKDSSKFLTEARNIGNRDDDIFLTSNPVSGFMRGFAGFFSDSLIIQSGLVVFKNSIEVVHIFSQDFRSGINIVAV